MKKTIAEILLAKQSGIQNWHDRPSVYHAWALRKKEVLLLFSTQVLSWGISPGNNCASGGGWDYYTASEGSQKADMSRALKNFFPRYRCQTYFKTWTCNIFGSKIPHWKSPFTLYGIFSILRRVFFSSLFLFYDLTFILFHSFPIFISSKINLYIILLSFCLFFSFLNLSFLFFFSYFTELLRI